MYIYIYIYNNINIESYYNNYNIIIWKCLKQLQFYRAVFAYFYQWPVFAYFYQWPVFAYFYQWPVLSIESFINIINNITLPFTIMLTRPCPTGRSSRVGQKWRRPDENIYENLRQYDLDHRFLDCLVADASQHSLWRHQPLFDAIITDRTWHADIRYTRAGIYIYIYMSYVTWTFSIL